jgi:uncharacterized membrane protein YhaH (DUF805 family)
MGSQLRRLLFSFRGRTTRGAFWWGLLVTGFAFVVLLVFLETVFSRSSSLILYPPLIWIAAALAFKRQHDRGKSPWWLLLVAIPILGPLWLAIDLGFRAGTPGENQYGQDPLEFDVDYLTVK